MENKKTLLVAVIAFILAFAAYSLAENNYESKVNKSGDNITGKLNFSDNANITIFRDIGQLSSNNPRSGSFEVYNNGLTDAIVTSIADNNSAVFSVFNNGGTSGNFLQMRAYGNTTGSTLFGLSTNKLVALFCNGDSGLAIGTSSSTNLSFASNGTVRMTINSGGGLTFADANNIAFNTTTGTKIGTATSQKLAFWNATPIVQPTTAVASAARVGGGGTTVTDTDTFGGYTIAQVVQALRNTGILA